MNYNTYPFADGDCLENRNSYFYTPYGGIGFIDAWRRQRDDALARLPLPKPPMAVATYELGEGQPMTTATLLDFIYSDVTAGDAVSPTARRWLDKLVKKFEVTKRLHESYDAGFRAVDPARYRSLFLYVRLAEILEAAYDTTDDLVFLNALLKCIDSLSSVEDHLTKDERARLAWLIERERHHVELLAEALRKR